MPRDVSARVVPPLGELCTVAIDPTWGQLHKQYWLEDNPIGLKQSFAFVDLEQGISESMQPNYADTEVVGRAEQYKTFVGSSNREIQLTFKFQAQGDRVGLATQIALQIAGGPGRSVPVEDVQRAVAKVQLSQWIEHEVVNPALWLDALKHPIVGDGGITYAPPPVLLRVGHLLRGVRCIVTAADVQWQLPFDPETLLPFAAEVPVTFTVVRTAIQRNLFKHRRQYI